MSTRALQAEQTRQQILETAERLLTEVGYEATSLQMIADEMGLTKAAVYYTSVPRPTSCTRSCCPESNG